MDAINIISIGNFKINNREFFEELLEATEEKSRKIKGIEGGEKFKYRVKENKAVYFNNHLISNDLNFTKLKRDVNKVLRDNEEHVSFLMYLIDCFDEKIFNESLSIIKEFSQNKSISFMLVYIDDGKDKKHFLNELENIMKVNVMKVQGTAFKFQIDEEKRKEFGEYIIRFCIESKKRKLIEDYSNFCIRNIYSSSIKLQNNYYNDEELKKFKNEFLFNIDKELIQSVEEINKSTKRISNILKLENIEELKIKDRINYSSKILDNSVLGNMAREVNKIERYSLSEKILFKVGLKKEEKKESDIERVLINEAFLQKKRIELSLKDFKPKFK